MNVTYTENTSNIPSSARERLAFAFGLARRSGLTLSVLLMSNFGVFNKTPRQRKKKEKRKRITVNHDSWRERIYVIVFADMQ